MFMLYAIALGLAAGLVLGGTVTGLGRLEFRLWPLALGGLAVQLVLFSPVAESVGALGPPIYVLSTALVAVAVLANVRQPGFSVVAAGAMCNLAAIVANGGFMPVTPEALTASGRVASVGYSNSVANATPALDVLVDRFVMPRGLPLANVFSLGDVLIGLGIVIVIATLMRAERISKREPAQ